MNESTLSTCDCTPATTTGTTARTYRPLVDIVELPGEYRVQAELPGVSPDDVDVSLEEGILKIQGTVGERNGESKVLACEYGVGDFYREIRLGDSIDHEKISAGYENGILTLHLPKVGAAKPRKIDIA